MYYIEIINIIILNYLKIYQIFLIKTPWRFGNTMVTKEREDNYAFKNLVKTVNDINLKKLDP
jgi:hypothetical protein